MYSTKFWKAMLLNSEYRKVSKKLWREGGWVKYNFKCPICQNMNKYILTSSFLWVCLFCGITDFGQLVFNFWSVLSSPWQRLRRPKGLPKPFHSRHNTPTMLLWPGRLYFCAANTSLDWMKLIEISQISLFESRSCQGVFKCSAYFLQVLWALSYLMWEMFQKTSTFAWWKSSLASLKT